jgi:hypothetical protein
VSGQLLNQFRADAFSCHQQGARAEVDCVGRRAKLAPLPLGGPKRWRPLKAVVGWPFRRAGLSHTRLVTARIVEWGRRHPSGSGAPVPLFPCGTGRAAMLNKRMILIAAVWSLLTPPALANCGDGDCNVGAAGQGGVASEGQAQGFRTEFPSIFFPGYGFSNTGNLDAGRLGITQPGEEPVGTTSGTFRQDSVRGRSTGVFGDWTGQCEIEEFPCDDLP